LKIAVVAPYTVFPPTSGAPARVFNLSSSLSDSGAQVLILHHGQTTRVSENLAFLNIKTMGNISNSGDYLHPFNFRFLNDCRDFLRKFKPDIIQCEGPWSTIPTLWIAKKLNIPCVIDEHNVEFLWSLSSSRIPFIAPYTFLIEKLAVAYTKLVLATSELDKVRISNLFKVEIDKIKVFPNGVTCQKFSKELSSVNLKKKIFLDDQRKVAFFHGLLSAKQNYEAARLIIEFIAPRVPNVLFIVAGKDSPKWLRAKSKVQKNVCLLDYVPNIEDYIKASDICIAPILSGSGTRLKILEYMAAGKPIVSTVVGAEGIPLKSGKNAILLDKVDSSFIDSMCHVLSNEATALELGSSAELLSRSFNWRSIGKSLYDFYSNFFI
jgi:polysaccharide biosynthesis protein PslH